jgi:hypothetical protein
MPGGVGPQVAPYSERMEGVFSRLPRRPASEGATNRNRNIAIMYASLHTLSAVMPKHAEEIRALLEDVGLDPDDQSTALSTPVGIGLRGSERFRDTTSHQQQLARQPGRVRRPRPPPSGPTSRQLSLPVREPRP